MEKMQSVQVHPEAFWCMTLDLLGFLSATNCG